MKNYKSIYSILVFALFLVFFMQLFIGSVAIDYSQLFNQNSIENELIFRSRLPAAIAAIISGAAIALSGLLLQSYFRNPIVDSSVLGISTGASFGLVLLNIVLLFPIAFHPIITNYLYTIFGFGGALLVAFLLIISHKKIKNNAGILIVGLLISGWLMAISQIMQTLISSDNLKMILFWSMGNFRNVTYEQLSIIAIIFFVSFFIILKTSKALNLFLLGTTNAKLAGIDVDFFQKKILLIVSLLTAVITVFCGPIAFVGLAVPHIARMLLKTSLHYHNIIVSCLLGAIFCGLCNVISSISFNGIYIPVNAITSLIGVPFTFWLMYKREKYANL